MPDFDRELLDAWDDPEVPSGFADRVLDAVDEAGPGDAGGSGGAPPWSVYAAVAALLLVGVTILFVPEAAPPPTAVEPVAVDVEGVTPMAVLSGSPVAAPEAVQCVVPDEVDFADKGRAMLKDSAELEWTVDEEARLNVHQRKGRVQYDLPAGEKVLLTTPNAVEALELEGRFEVDLEASDEASINAY
ncbi:MAG: hypothetical protein GY898_32715 [Proteobacteria bacterium]|nr:hypothetical protein [Pseudomonadota bacterium]